MIDFVADAEADINPYKILGVGRNADEKEIRNAYKKLAKNWHPDKNKSPDAHEKFMKINQAYEVRLLYFFIWIKSSYVIHILKL